MIKTKILKILNNIILSLVCFFFANASAGEKDLRFIIVGHIYPIIKDTEKLNNLIRKINEYKSDYVFILGDSNLQDKETFDYFNTAIDSKIYYSPGNNELSISRENYINNVGYLEKVVIDNKIKFILLNSSESKENVTKFLNNALKVNDGLMPIILTHHRIWDDTIISKNSYEHDKSYFFEDIYPIIKDKVNYIFAGNSKRQYFRDLQDLVSYGKQNINLIYWMDKIGNIDAYSVGMGDGKPKAGFVIVDFYSGSLNVRGDYATTEYDLLPKDLIAFDKNRLSLEHTSELKDFVKSKYFLVNKTKFIKIISATLIFVICLFMFKWYLRKKNF